MRMQSELLSELKQCKQPLAACSNWQFLEQAWFFRSSRFESYLADRTHLILMMSTIPTRSIGLCFSWMAMKPDPAEGLMKKKTSSRAKKRMINAYLQQAVKLKIAA